jgi:hypothetical protein
VIFYKRKDLVDISLLFVIRADVRRIQMEDYKIDIRGLLRNTNIIFMKKACRLLLRNKIITNLALTLVNLRKVTLARLAYNLRFVNRDKDVKELVDVISVENIK